MRPVVLAYDGSPGATLAIARAGQLLQHREAVVVHVWAGLSHLLLRPRYQELLQPLRETAAELDTLDRGEAERIAAEGARFATEAEFEAETLAVEQTDKVWQAILSASIDKDAAVIVAGTSGRSGLADAILGSVAQSLVTHTSIPVLLVPPTEEEESSSGPVLFCYDGTEGARRAIEVAGPLLKAREARVFHTWDSWVARPPGLVPVVSGSVAAMTKELEEIGEELSTEVVDVGCAIAAQAGFRATPSSVSTDGSMWKAILERASEEDASVVVVGSRGVTGLTAVLGSVSHGVVHHARRPVLVVPEQWQP